MFDAKQHAVERVLGSVPAAVRYLPIDFDTHPLGSALAAAGYRTGDKALFILEGVSMHINAAGTDATLAFMAPESASRLFSCLDIREIGTCQAPQTCQAFRVSIRTVRTHRRCP